MTLDKESARRRVWALRDDLREIAACDPGREVSGLALPVVEAVLCACKDVVDAGDPVVHAINDLVLPQRVSRAPLRADEALLVIRQVEISLGRPPRRGTLFG